MCGGYFYQSYDTSEQFRKDNPEYTYTKFTNASGEVAFLVEDTQETEPSLRFDVVYPYGDTFGWGSKEECLLELATEGFKEATEEQSAVDGEAVNAG